MWNAVAALDCTTPAPSARSKHSATLVGDHVYLLGGRNGNLPLKDFWRYNLGKWCVLEMFVVSKSSLNTHLETITSIEQVVKIFVI